MQEAKDDTNGRNPVSLCSQCFFFTSNAVRDIYIFQLLSGEAVEKCAQLQRCIKMNAKTYFENNFCFAFFHLEFLLLLFAGSLVIFS